MNSSRALGPAGIKYSFCDSLNILILSSFKSALVKVNGEHSLIVHGPWAYPNQLIKTPLKQVF